MAQQRVNNWIKGANVFVVLFTILLLGTPNHSAFALTLNQYPDIRLTDVNVNQSAGVFTTSGALAETYFAGPGNSTGLYNSVLGSYAYFDLSAVLGSGQAASGSFAIYDDTDGSNSYSAGDTLYLSGTLTSKIFSNTAYEFLFTPTYGKYKDNGAYKTEGDINISIVGDGDVRTPVPEPATVSLLLLGIGGMCLIRRRKSQS